MSVAPLHTLISSLERLEVPCHRTTRDEFAETVTKLVDAPAVGVSLEDLGVSLEDTDVTVDPTPAALKAATTGVTPVEFAIADYGSVVIPSTPSGCELVSLFVDRHVAVLDEGDVLSDMEAAFERFGERIRADSASAIIATGPSATADMGELVRGAHGPKDVNVVVLEDSDE